MDAIATAEGLMATVEWKALGLAPEGHAGTPYATYACVLSIDGQDVRCYHLSDGRQAIDAEDAERSLGLMVARGLSPDNPGSGEVIT
jgi:cobalamin biosynthesis protein CobD/CbiB